MATIWQPALGLYWCESCGSQSTTLRVCCPDSEPVHIVKRAYRPAPLFGGYWVCVMCGAAFIGNRDNINDSRPVWRDYPCDIWRK